CTEFQMQPFLHTRWALGEPDNIWGEPRDKTFKVNGHRAAGQYLARRLLEDDRPVAYAYKPGLHHPGLAHAFMNAILYLDYDRTGFDYPVLPFHVNCYGSDLVRNRGGNQHLWRDIPLAEIEASGQAEFLNWVCLAGAMTQLAAKVEILDFTDSYIFNSSKCTMLGRPARSLAGVA